MSRRAMLMAAVSALVGGAALHLYLARFEAELAGGAPRPVLIVTRDLALGEVVTRGVLDLKELPESYVEERHISGQDLQRVIGTRVTSAVTAGGALLWTDLDTLQDGRTLSGLVRVGMRGFALPEHGVSFDGLLRPGDRVDVVFTAAGPTAKARTLLANLMVLTVGRDLGQAGGPREPSGDRVTLSVSPEQATILAQTEGAGKLRLALRNPQDAWVPPAPSVEGEPRNGAARAALAVEAP